jgi:UrcA family protein
MITGGLTEVQMNSGAIIFLLAVTTAAPAAADPPTATVTVTRADFSTPKSRAKLNRRVRNAIEAVCGSYATIESYQWPEMDACWASARAETSRKLAAMSRQTPIELGSR